MTTINEALEKDPIGLGLNILEYIVYLDAGKHVSIYNKIPTNKKWWEFWKDKYTLEDKKLTVIEQAVNGKDFVKDYYRINPYTSLIERIDKLKIKSRLAQVFRDEVTSLAVDVVYGCPTGYSLFKHEDMFDFFKQI